MSSIPFTIPVPPPTPELSSAPLATVEAWFAALRAFDRALDVTVFGAQGAAEYRRLQRVANSPLRIASDPAVLAADARIAAMEEGLAPEAQALLFGLSLPPDFIAVEDAHQVLKWIHAIESATCGIELDRLAARLTRAARILPEGPALSHCKSGLFLRLTFRASALGLGAGGRWQPHA